MANLVKETNNILIEVDGGKNTYRLPLNTIRTEILGDSVRIISMLDRTVLIDFKPYDEYTIEGSPVTKPEDLIDWCVANFFVDASSGGGIPELGASEVIIGGTSGNEVRKLKPIDLGWLSGTNQLFNTPTGTTITTIQYSAFADPSVIVQRNANGSLVSNEAVSDSDVIINETFKGVMNLSLGVDTTMSTLNSTYLDAPIGFCVHNPQVRVFWKKITSTTWMKIETAAMS